MLAAVTRTGDDAVLAIEPRHQLGQVAQLAAQIHQHAVAARAEVVLVVEEGAGGNQLVAFPLQAVEGLDVEGIGQAELTGDHVGRQQRILQAGVGQHHAADVHRVDHVDAVGVVDALAPVDHLAANTQAVGHLAGIAVGVEVGIEQARTMAGAVAQVRGVALVAVGVVGGEAIPAGIVVHDLGVVPGGAAHEQAVLLGAHVQLGSQLELVGDETGVVVLAAIVVVGKDVLPAALDALGRGGAIHRGELGDALQRGGDIGPGIDLESLGLHPPDSYPDCQRYLALVMRHAAVP